MPGLTHAADTPRRMSSLDGIWQIAEGGMDQAPASFECTVPVLGLVNMARPVFVEPGPKMGNREQIPHKDSRRDAVTAAAAWGFDFEIIDLSLYLDFEIIDLSLYPPRAGFRSLRTAPRLRTLQGRAKTSESSRVARGFL